jgi:hypothetical protein
LNSIVAMQKSSPTHALFQTASYCLRSLEFNSAS